MSVTILGSHIRLIRPEKIKKPIIFKTDRPRCKYNKKPSSLIKVNINWAKVTIPPEPTYYSH